MKKFTSALGRMCFITLLCVAMCGNAANATIYTATATGGNFNAGTTWVGGVAPGALISSDVVTIPALTTVTLTSNEVFSGTSSLTVLGTLNSVAGTTLAITSGTLAGTGTIAADSMSLGLIAGFTYTGAITARALTSLGANVASAATVTVNKSLNLTTGILNMTAGNLIMGNLSTITMAGGTIVATLPAILALDSTYNVIYTLASATAGTELSGTGFNNLTVNVPSGTVTLAANQTINGALTLTAGALSLAGNMLTFGPASSLSASGTGTITGSATSNLVVNTTGGLTTAIPFTTGSNMLDNLTLNTTTGGVAMGSDLALSGMLTLTSGALSLNGHTLTLNTASNIAAGAGTITGSATSNLVVNTTGGLANALSFTAGSNMLNNLTLNTTTGGAAMGSDLALSGMLTLSSGALSLNGHMLTLNSAGNIAGAGTITGSATSSLVVNTTGGLTSPIPFTSGSSMLDNLTLNTTTGGVAMASDLALSGWLTLTSGTLSLNGHMLTLNATGNVAASGTGTITGSTTSNLVVNTTGGLTGAIRFATGAGGALNNLTLNTTTGSAALGSNLALSGLLTLTSGALSLGGNTLTFNPTANIIGAGTITGSITSNLVVNTTGGLTSLLAFTTGSNMLDNLTLNTTTGGATMGSDLALSGVLTLASGALSLNGHTLTLNPTANIAGTGTLTGSATSNLVVNTTGGLTNALSFTTGSNMLNNLTLNTTTGGATLASDLALSGMLTLTSGALSLAGHTLTLNTASNIAAGAGTITGSTTSDIIVNTSGGLTNPLPFTASSSMLNNLTLNTGTGGAALGSNLALSGMLALTSGALSLNGHMLTLNPTADIAGTGTITGSALSSLVVNTTGGLTSPIPFTTGSNMLNNLSLNTTTGGATMGSDLALSGLLTLTSGTLSLNGHTLTLNANADISSATGTLTGSASSNMIVNTTFGLTSALTFAPGGNMLNNLTVNMGSGSDNIMLGSNLTIQGMLNLQSGNVQLGGNDLDIATAGTVTGGSENSYVMTNGSGSLIMALATAATDTFKVGSATNFAPMALTANAGASTGNASINVADGVLSNGTSGTLLTASDPLVNATWFVSSTASSINYNMLAMWSAGMEINGFDRASAYISHYTSGAWDMQTAAAATTIGTMYVMSRTGITSLSPFMVVSTAGLLVPVVNSAGLNVSIYPNPASNTLSYTTAATVNNLEISNATGQVVKSANGLQKSVSVEDLPTGIYFIHFSGNDLNTVKQFVKE